MDSIMHPPVVGGGSRALSNCGRTDREVTLPVML